MTTRTGTQLANKIAGIQHYPAGLAALLLLLAVTAQTQTYAVLHNFSGGSDGVLPKEFNPFGR